MNKTHGLTKHHLFRTWKNMRARCSRECRREYKYYGGRGITVCDEWKNDFITFYNWAINNGYKEKLQLDRIETNGNYEPGNCRFVTPTEQNSNKRNNVLITYNGETKLISVWAKQLGFQQNTLHYRLKKTSVSEAFTLPIGKHPKKTISKFTRA